MITKRRVAMTIIGLAAVCSLRSCNKQIIDTTYTYDRAIIYLPNGIVVDGKVQS